MTTTTGEKRTRAFATSTGGKNILLHSAGLVSTGFYVCLALFSKQETPVDLTAFYSLMGGAWVLLLGLLFYYFKTGALPQTRTILVWAIIFRLAGLAAEPVYEDDYFRFLWDGWVFAETGNPYGIPPMEYFSQTGIPKKIGYALERLNNPDAPTIYGPVLQGLFILSYWAAPGNLFVLKLFFLLFDISLLALMARFCTGRNLLFYAWCPLLVFEISFNAHPDIVGAVLLTAAFFCRKKERFSWAIALCAAAASVKIFALIALPFLSTRGSRLKDAAVFLFTFGFLHLPFLVQGSAAEFEGLVVFGKFWEFNSALFGVFGLFLRPELARPTCLLIFAALLVTLWRRWQKSENTAIPLDTVFGLFFLCSPVINPWYLLWLVPFAAMRLRFWSIAALIAVSLSYITGINLGDSALGNFEHPLWLRPVEFGIVILGLGLDAVQRHSPIKARILRDKRSEHPNNI